MRLLGTNDEMRPLLENVAVRPNTKRFAPTPDILQQAPKPLSEAQAAVEKLASDRARMVASSVALSEKMDSLRRDAGARYLNGDKDALKEVSGISLELETIAAALELLDELQLAAEFHVQRSTAADLRDQAKNKRRELAALHEKTAKVLAELSKLEGVTFTHSVLSSQPVDGVWLLASTLKPPLEHLGLLEIIPNVPIHGRLVEWPLSRRLLDQIEELDLRAERIEISLALA